MTGSWPGTQSGGAPGVLSASGQRAGSPSTSRADLPSAFAPPENVQLVKALLDHGADRNLHPGRTGVLHMAVPRGILRQSVCSLNIAPIRLPDRQFFTPPMSADALGASLLIKHGANVNASGYKDDLPTRAAAEPGSEAAAKVSLLRYMARKWTREISTVRQL